MLCLFILIRSSVIFGGIFPHAKALTSHPSVEKKWKKRRGKKGGQNLLFSVTQRRRYGGSSAFIHEALKSDR
jgi:hypothetical protein